MKESNKYCILIPCSINVWAKKTTLTDKLKRKKEYMRSIIFWILQPYIKDIIICENTGAYFLPESVNQLAKILSKNIEFLTFCGNREMIFSKGKGYGEGEILEYAINNSKLIKQHKAFLKITGKLSILNFRSIISCHKFNEKNNYFMLSAPKIFRKIDKVDTRFFFVQVSFFKEILCDVYKTVDEERGINLERAFYQKLRENKKQIMVFPIIPILEGVSGSTGKIYSFSPNKYFLKNLLNKFGLYKI